MGHPAAVIRYLLVIAAFRAHHGGAGPALVPEATAGAFCRQPDSGGGFPRLSPGLCKAHLEHVRSLIREHPTGQEAPLPGHPEAALSGAAPDALPLQGSAVLPGVGAKSLPALGFQPLQEGLRPVQEGFDPGGVIGRLLGVKRSLQPTWLGSRRRGGNM